MVNVIPVPGVVLTEANVNAEFFVHPQYIRWFGTECLKAADIAR
jgi:hypothetical protein